MGNDARRRARIHRGRAPSRARARPRHHAAGLRLQHAWRRIARPPRSEVPQPRNATTPDAPDVEIIDCHGHIFPPPGEACGFPDVATQLRHQQRPMHVHGNQPYRRASDRAIVTDRPLWKADDPSMAGLALGHAERGALLHLPAVPVLCLGQLRLHRACRSPPHLPREHARPVRPRRGMTHGPVPRGCGPRRRARQPGASDAGGRCRRATRKSRKTRTRAGSRRVVVSA